MREIWLTRKISLFVRNDNVFCHLDEWNQERSDSLARFLSSSEMTMFFVSSRRIEWGEIWFTRKISLFVRNDNDSFPVISTNGMREIWLTRKISLFVRNDNVFFVISTNEIRRDLTHSQDFSLRPKWQFFLCHLDEWNEERSLIASLTFSECVKKFCNGK